MRSLEILAITFLLNYPLQARASSTFYQDILPAALCDDGSYFRECFPIKKTTCILEIKSIGENCFNQLQSELLSLKKDSTKSIEAVKTSARIKIGTCIGQNFEKKLASKKVSSSQCSSEKGW